MPTSERMKFRSIRQKFLLTLIPLAIIPVILLGIAGIIYLMDVTEKNIADDNLSQAKSVALYMGDYLNSSRTFLESLATRPYLIRELADGKYEVANTTIEYAMEKGGFDVVYITDPGGTIVTSYPNPALRAGRNYSDRPYVGNVILTGKPFTGGPYENLTGYPTIFQSVPIVDDNGTLLGVLVSQADPVVLAEKFFHTQVRNTQYIYMVNESGIVILHSNKSFMRQITDFSSVPPVKEVTRGLTGFIDNYYNPVERETRLAAYAPVPGTGWGAVVALPMDIVHQPVYDSAIGLAIISIAIAALAGAVAWLLGKAIARPIVDVSTATKKMTNGGDYFKYLPVKRNDEIGELARSFDSMTRRIVADKERITEEKNRAELYLDVMGHDINNLNQSAMANLEIIENDPGLTVDERLSISEALVAVRGSAGIIDNVRKIQRINEEKLDIAPEDLNGPIEACVRQMPRPPDKKVVINYTPRPGMLVNGNPLLREVFCNLVGNSIKYSGNEVTIDITVEKTNRAGREYYDVKIEDDGFGIPDEVKPRLFQRFQRGTTRAHGKGLGLYIVRSLVEKLGGSVTVGDRVQGDYTKGSRFVISLPLYEERGDGNNMS